MIHIYKVEVGVTGRLQDGQDRVTLTPGGGGRATVMLGCDKRHTHTTKCGEKGSRFKERDIHTRVC